MSKYSFKELKGKPFVKWLSKLKEVYCQYCQSLFKPKEDDVVEYTFDYHELSSPCLVVCPICGKETAFSEYSNAIYDD